MSSRVNLRAGLPLLLLATLPGCAEEPVETQVTGRVLVRGKPTAGVYLALYPDSDDADATALATRTQADGGFSLTTPGPGRYAVTAFWPAELYDEGAVVEGPDRFGGRYRNPKRPLTTIQVEEGVNQLDPIQLK